MTHVVGFCPMGCGATLMLGDGGHVTCGHLACTNPIAVDTILAERETEHVAVFGERSFSLQHPLRERVNGGLFQCPLHAYITDLVGPPVVPGRYRVRTDAAQRPVHYEPLPVQS